MVTFAHTRMSIGFCAPLRFVRASAILQSESASTLPNAGLSFLRENSCSSRATMSRCVRVPIRRKDPNTLVEWGRCNACG